MLLIIQTDIGEVPREASGRGSHLLVLLVTIAESVHTGAIDFIGARALTAFGDDDLPPLAALRPASIWAPLCTAFRYVATMNPIVEEVVAQSPNQQTG